MMMPKAFRKSFIIILIALICSIGLLAIAADYKYVGSAKSNKYHYPFCVWAQKIKPENLVTFQSAKEAQEKGYVPCKVCKPPVED